MGQVEEVRKRWIDERPTFEEFAQVLKDRLNQLMKRAGVWFDVSARAKTLDSFVKKLLKENSQYTYDTISDKVGARVVVRYISELDLVIDVVQGGLALGAVENKLATLGPERFGYLSIHVDRVSLRAGDPEYEHFPPQRFFAELQVRTLAQHLWSEMSHDTAYKTVGESIPPEMRRRVNLMAGQIEVADREFDRIGRESRQTREGQALAILEPHYYRLSTRRPDGELTIEILRKLLPSLELPADYLTPGGTLDGFLASQHAELAAAYDHAATDDEPSLVHQPEALLIYERLMHDQLGFRRLWNQHFPEKELERLGLFFGLSFE